MGVTPSKKNPRPARLVGVSEDRAGPHPALLLSYRSAVRSAPMTVTQAKQFQSFEEYLKADPAQLPEGRFEYWDGALVQSCPNRDLTH
jgi:hypothetical protein